MRDLINSLRKETETTLRVFYALRQFQWFLTTSEGVRKINRNLDFWRIYESSLRTNMFIGIRRLYEAKSGTFNFQKFIDSCKNNISLFSKDALRARKIRGSCNAHEWIDDYMKDIYEPNESDFDLLAKLVREKSKKMKGPYIDAATKIYAHAIHMDHASMNMLSEKLNFEEIEEGLTSIWHAYEQTWHMFENGTQPHFEIRPYPYAQEVINSVIKQVG